MIIDKSQDLFLDKESSDFEILGKDIELKLDVKEDCNVFLRIREVNSLIIKGLIPEDKKVSLFFWNECENPFEAIENYDVGTKAELVVGYGECNSASVKRSVSVNLEGERSKGKVSTASLLNCKKNYSIRVVNNNIHTDALMNNYAVVLKGGELMIDAIGQILNGAHKSTSHQTSRALSFEEGQKATILPELLIDENDVQASHAMSIGRVDEAQLYYLMSRGLDIAECTKLISLGYLLPIADIIEDEQLRMTIQSELENRINSLCMM